jgi:hypothetical protein
MAQTANAALGAQKTLPQKLELAVASYHEAGLGQAN